MKKITVYLWILFSLSLISTSEDASTSRNGPHNYYRQVQKSATRASSGAKHGERKASNSPHRRLSGRHVCTQSKVTMIPIKDVQSYCRPVYQSYLRRCDKDNSRYCSGYRVAYATAYRAVQRMVAQTESVYSCCPGWAQVRASSADCKRALCREECQNGGTCSKPDHCACAQGWTGKTCATDVDECASGKASCEHNCTNIPGSFMCSCQEGFVLQHDGKTCKEVESKLNKEYGAEISKKMEDLQKRLSALESWQRGLEDEPRHAREDRINSLSEQIALLEERLEECSCNKKDVLSFPDAQK